MIVKTLKKLTNRENLTKEEIKLALSSILEGRATDAQIAAFLTALRMKGETVEEITGAVEILKDNAQTLNLQNRNIIDIVGTGGDDTNSFNISTAASFVVAAGGVKVAKHGSRAASSKSGAADILEALGANIFLNPEQNLKLLDRMGICFMFAPKYSPLLKNAANVRQEIKIRTIFNCLGPLINPSGASMQLIGVYNKNLLEPVVSVMKNLGVKKGIVVHGECGLDEVSIVSKTYYAKLKDNKIETGQFAPEDFNFKRATLEDIRGGVPYENAKILKGIFENKIQGAKKDVVVLNAALAFLVAERVSTFEEGIKLAAELIENDSVHNLLLQFIEGTNEYPA